jgi:hypothetical protein
MKTVELAGKPRKKQPLCIASTFAAVSHENCCELGSHPVLINSTFAAQATHNSTLQTNQHWTCFHQVFKNLLWLASNLDLLASGVQEQCITNER